MATESVIRPAHRGLALKDVDAAHELIEKAIGVADIIGIASTSKEPTRDASVPSACWALVTMLEDLRAIIDGKETVGVEELREAPEAADDAIEMGDAK